MPFSHEYRVEECGRTQKLRGPGGEGALCEFCNRAFATSKECSKHVEVDKVCRRRRRQQRRSVRERVKQIIASNDEDSGISMEEEEERARLPVRIMINLAKKEVVASKNSKEAKTVSSSWSERLPRIESQNSTPSPQITSMSSPNLSDSAPMVKIKTEILNDLAAGIKSEPGEEPNKSAASGIRVALEKTRGRRYSVAFTSALASSEEDLNVGDKVSKKEKHSHKTDRGEPAPKETKKNTEERNSHNHDGTSNQKIKWVKNESRRVQSDKVKRQVQACSGENAGNASNSPRVKVKKSEIAPAVKKTIPALEEVVHLSEGTINLQVPERLIGTWVAFDSSFLPTLNTIFCFRLNKDRKVDILCKTAPDKNKNVLVSKYSLHFSTGRPSRSVEGLSNKKLPLDKVSQDKATQDMMALERSLKGLPNKKVPLDKDLCSGPLLRYHLSISTKI